MSNKASLKLPTRYANAKTFSFGDSAALNEELLALVLSGKKTATCGALRDFGDGPDQEAMPVQGRVDIALDNRKKPSCALETIGVSICRFDEVAEDFALAEGEGNFTEWRKGHIAFFQRNGGWSPDMELVCERFKLVEVFHNDQ